MITRAIRHCTIVLALAAVFLAGAALVARVHAEPSGPVAAIGKAHKVADAESANAHAQDATAATLGADTGKADETEDEAVDDDGDAAAAEGNHATATAEEAKPAAAPANAAGAPTAPAKPGESATADAPAAGVANVPSGAPRTVIPPAQITYDPAQHRDPFRPPSLTTTVAQNESPKTPLERYELGQLKLVGVITQGNGARAMVEDSAGLGYIVTNGTPIGSSGGVVTRIEPRRVLIEETVTNFYGEKEPKQIVMELPKEDRSP